MVPALRCALTLLVTALLLAGCGGEPMTITTTVTTPIADEAAATTQPLQTEIAKRLIFVANREVRKLAIKTCGSFPQSALIEGFGGEKGVDYDANSIALQLYAAEVSISPIRLQEAAADGCRIGQGRRKRSGVAFRRGPVIHGFNDVLATPGGLTNSQLEEGTFDVATGTCRYDRFASQIGWEVRCESQEGDQARTFTFTP